MSAAVTEARLGRLHSYSQQGGREAESYAASCGRPASVNEVFFRGRDRPRSEVHRPVSGPRAARGDRRPLCVRRLPVMLHRSDPTWIDPKRKLIRYEEGTVKKCYWITSLLVFLAGCVATGYGPKSMFSGGFEETQLGPDIFSVSFSCNDSTSMARAADFTLLRSAELTLENGR